MAEIVSYISFRFPGVLDYLIQGHAVDSKNLDQVPLLWEAYQKREFKGRSFRMILDPATAEELAQFLLDYSEALISEGLEDKRWGIKSGRYYEGRQAEKMAGVIFQALKEV